jgi:DNA polymerase-4
VVVEQEQVSEFLAPLPVEKIWGVGRRGSQVFHRLGVRTVGQIRPLPLNILTQHFGSSGEHFWRLARGIDDRPVVPDRDAKSISHETTFEQDIDDRDALRAWLLDLTEQVGWRLRRNGLRGRTVQIKIRFADFSTITRSHTLPKITNLTEELWQAAEGLLRKGLQVRHAPAVRLLGMGVSGLDDSGLAQSLLFDQEKRQRQGRLDSVKDQLKSRFGPEALCRGSTLMNVKKPKCDTR